ncbi:hypothetical protein H4582DRAFT_2052934 [Lactarius indigo]|nr:hypothetical protein H4582DRAFT_2052934 [Lactarius indigo]
MSNEQGIVTADAKWFRPLRCCFLRFSSPKTELVLPFWPDLSVTVMTGMSPFVLGGYQRPSLNWGEEVRDHRFKPPGHGPDGHLVKGTVTNCNMTKTETSLTCLGPTEERPLLPSRCGTITTVWQAQVDLLNPERRAALSAGWACLEWSGTSGTATHPGRGSRRYGRVRDKRLHRSPAPARSLSNVGAGGELRGGLDSLGQKGMEKDRQGPSHMGKRRDLLPQSARVYSATGGDEKTMHFYQENTGFETNRDQIMCLLEEGHEQWMTRTLDVMLRLESALLQPNVSDEGSRGGNAPCHGPQAENDREGRHRALEQKYWGTVFGNAGALYAGHGTKASEGELLHATTSFSAGGVLVTKQSVWPIWRFGLPRWGSYKARRVYGRRRERSAVRGMGNLAPKWYTSGSLWVTRSSGVLRQGCQKRKDRKACCLHKPRKISKKENPCIWAGKRREDDVIAKSATTDRTLLGPPFETPAFPIRSQLEMKFSKECAKRSEFDRGIWGEHTNGLAPSRFSEGY